MGPELEAVFRGCKNRVWERLNSVPQGTQTARSAGFWSPGAHQHGSWPLCQSSSDGPAEWGADDSNHPTHMAISRVSQTLAKENTGLFYSLHPQSHTGPLSQAPCASSRRQVAKDLSSLLSSSLHFVSDLFKERSPGTPWRTRHQCPLWWTQLWGRGPGP